MKIVIAGAYGNLGVEILKKAVGTGHKVVALDKGIKKVEGIEGLYEKKQIDVMDKKTLDGIFKDADVVITTVGLTTSSNLVTHYDIDLKGNINLLDEAKKIRSQKVYLYKRN